MEEGGVEGAGGEQREAGLDEDQRGAGRVEQREDDGAVLREAGPALVRTAGRVVVEQRAQLAVQDEAVGERGGELRVEELDEELDAVGGGAEEAGAGEGRAEDVGEEGPPLLVAVLPGDAVEVRPGEALGLLGGVCGVLEGHLDGDAEDEAGRALGGGVHLVGAQQQREDELGGLQARLGGDDAQRQVVRVAARGVLWVVQEGVDGVGVLWKIVCDISRF